MSLLGHQRPDVVVFAHFDACYSKLFREISLCKKKNIDLLMSVEVNTAINFPILQSNVSIR